MRRFVIHVLVTAVALAVTAWMVPGIHVASVPALFLAALTLGLVNAVVRPVLLFITFPITLLTLGLFYFVVNGAAFGLAAALAPGFEIDGFGWAILGAMVVGITSWIVGALVRA